MILQQMQRIIDGFDAMRRIDSVAIATRSNHGPHNGTRTHDLRLESQTPYFCISSVTKVENGEKEEISQKTAKSMRFLRDGGRRNWRTKERLRL